MSENHPAAAALLFLYLSAETSSARKVQFCCNDYTLPLGVVLQLDGMQCT